MPPKRKSSLSMMRTKRRRVVPRRNKFAVLRRGLTKFARTAASRRGIARAISQSTRNVLSETKLRQLNPGNEIIPEAIQTGALVYKKGFVLQNIPNLWDPTLYDMGGIDVASGVDGNQRVGNYVFYKKTTANFQIDMNFVTAARPPAEFRMIVCKAKQSAQPAGTTDLPQNSLFLNNVGAQIGYQTGGVTGMDIMLQPLNRRDWVIFKDTKFTLSHPLRTDSDGGQVGYSGKYPCRKNVRLGLNHFKKSRLVGDTPQDYDAHYLVYIFASAIGKDLPANGWEVSLRGTTSYSDN